MNICVGVKSKSIVSTAIAVILLLLIVTVAVRAADTLSPRSISMDFQEAALKDILKVFSQQSGMNFVASKNIEGRRITLYLDGVTVEDALNSIMKANNLAYEQESGSSVFVVKDSGTAKIPLMTKVYTLNFVRLQGIGEEAATTTGSSGTEEDQEDIELVLKTILTKGDDGKQLGSIVIDKRTNSIVVTAIPEDFPLIEKTIAELDSATPQALIEAEIVEIQTSAIKKLGLEWGGTTSGTFVSFTGPERSTKFPFIRKSGPFQDRLLGGVAETNVMGTLSLSEFSLVIKALETEGMARYLAKPRIMALNNETAEINITADTIVGVKTTSQTTTGSITEEPERVSTGVSLKVTPTINRNNYITMTVEPEVSRAIRSTFFTNYADPSKRAAKTTVMIKGGQTIAIGGLLKSDEETSNRSTPGLSNVPFLGNLFKRDNVEQSGTELIIFITAHVIRNAEDAEGYIPASESRQQEQGYQPAAMSQAEAAGSGEREEEIRKTVIKLRKKREVAGGN